jgi:hypothetical protein
MLQVFSPGSRVTIGAKGADVPAVVRQVCIAEGDNVTYECSWWDNRDRKVAWFAAHEVFSSDPVRRTIGFTPAR